MKCSDCSETIELKHKRNEENRLENYWYCDNCEKVIDDPTNVLSIETMQNAINRATADQTNSIDGWWVTDESD